MSMLLINIVLAIIWTALSGNVSTTGFLFGLICGYLVLFLMRPVLSDTNYFQKTYGLFSFLIFFLKEVVKSSIRVAYDVITPSHISEPGILAIPLAAETDMEITMLANLITLTPGTMSLDVSEDRKQLYIHAMFAGNPDEIRYEIKNNLEARLLKLMR